VIRLLLLVGTAIAVVWVAGGAGGRFDPQNGTPREALRESVRALADVSRRAVEQLADAAPDSAPKAGPVPSSDRSVAGTAPATAERSVVRDAVSLPPAAAARQPFSSDVPDAIPLAESDVAAHHEPHPESQRAAAWQTPLGRDEVLDIHGRLDRVMSLASGTHR